MSITRTLKTIVPQPVKKMLLPVRDYVLKKMVLNYPSGRAGTNWTMVYFPMRITKN